MRALSELVRRFSPVIALNKTGHGDDGAEIPSQNAFRRSTRSTGALPARMPPRSGARSARPLGATYRTRLYRRACQRLRHGLAGSLGRQPRRVNRIRPAARARRPVTVAGIHEIWSDRAVVEIIPAGIKPSQAGSSKCKASLVRSLPLQRARVVTQRVVAPSVFVAVIVPEGMHHEKQACIGYRGNCRSTDRFGRSSRAREHRIHGYLPQSIPRILRSPSSVEGLVRLRGLSE